MLNRARLYHFDLSQHQFKAMAKPVPMSRDEKLERWASLIEISSEPVFIFHDLEHKSKEPTRDWLEQR
jgi:hypothetical protein